MESDLQIRRVAIAHMSIGADPALCGISYKSCTYAFSRRVLDKRILHVGLDLHRLASGILKNSSHVFRFVRIRCLHRDSSAKRETWHANKHDKSSWIGVLG